MTSEVCQTNLTRLQVGTIMKNRTRITVLFSLLMLSLLLTACGGEEPVATATPTKTPTPLATDTPVPTDTPAPPTNTPVPTNTPEPTATPTPEGTPTPTPTAAPVAFVQPSQDDVNTRKGPGTSYGKVGQVTRADKLGVYGKSADGGWYKICCINSQEAWIAKRFCSAQRRRRQDSRRRSAPTQCRDAEGCRSSIARIGRRKWPPSWPCGHRQCGPAQ